MFQLYIADVAKVNWNLPDCTSKEIQCELNVQTSKMTRSMDFHDELGNRNATYEDVVPKIKLRAFSITLVTSHKATDFISDGLVES